MTAYTLVCAYVAYDNTNRIVERCTSFGRSAYLVPRLYVRGVQEKLDDIFLP